jgi:hypothetical protein
MSYLRKYSHKRHKNKKLYKERCRIFGLTKYERKEEF